MCILPSLSVLLSQSMNYALIPVSHTAITLGCSCVIDWHVLHSPWLLLCSLSSQSQFKFVCEAILKVYEEGLVKPLKSTLYESNQCNASFSWKWCWNSDRIFSTWWCSAPWQSDGEVSQARNTGHKPRTAALYAGKKTNARLQWGEREVTKKSNKGELGTCWDFECSGF